MRIDKKRYRIIWSLIFRTVFSAKAILLFINFSLSLIGFNCYLKRTDTSVIRIKGSDTMIILTSRLAQEFMKKYPDISIYVDGGGTKTGIDALLKGKIDICAASRLLKSDEIKTMSDLFRTVGVSTLIAKDALSIFINIDNPIKNYSLDDIKNIFTCSKVNWSDFGGENKPIKVFARSPNSGTYLYFKEHALENQDYCQSAIVRASTFEIAEEVSKDKYAIGYGGIGYKENISHAFINNIAPIEENVRNDSYPLSRYLFFVMRDNPKGIIKLFIDWVLSPEGQEIVRKVGFIPLWN